MPMMPWRVSDGILLNSPLWLSRSLCSLQCTPPKKHSLSTPLSLCSACQSRPSRRLLQCQYGISLLSLPLSGLCPAQSPRLCCGVRVAFFDLPIPLSLPLRPLPLSVLCCRASFPSLQRSALRTAQQNHISPWHGSAYSTVFSMANCALNRFAFSICLHSFINSRRTFQGARWPVGGAIGDCVFCLCGCIADSQWVGSLRTSHSTRPFLCVHRATQQQPAGEQGHVFILFLFFLKREFEAEAVTSDSYRNILPPLLLTPSRRLSSRRFRSPSSQH